MSIYPACCLLLLWLQSGDFAERAEQAEAARHGNRLNEAVGLYREALAMKPSWTEGWFALGTIQYDRNEYEDAGRAFQQVVGLDAKSGTARIMLGLCEFELGRDEPALQDIEAGERLGAADDANLQHVALYHQGLLLQRKGQFEEAQKVLDAVCRDGVESAAIEVALGRVALRLRDESLPEAAKRIGRAQCLAAQKKFAEAQEVYAAAVNENPRLLNMHYAYGRFLLQGPHTDAALAEFKKEIELHPGHVLARLQIAAVLYKVDSAAGLPYAEAAVKLDPGLPLGHYLLGVLRLDLDDVDGAIPELELARERLRDDARVHYSLGLAYARVGREREAAEEREEFQRLSKAERN